MPVLELGKDDWLRVMETNLAGTLRACQTSAANIPGVAGRVIFRLALICPTSGAVNVKIV